MSVGGSVSGNLATQVFATLNKPLVFWGSGTNLTAQVGRTHTDTSTQTATKTASNEGSVSVGNGRHFLQYSVFKNNVK